jgi:uncharacterized protein (TIGR02757 family)
MSAMATYEVKPDALHQFLERKVKEYNRPAFIVADPISIPHAYSKKQDIEVAGFFAAVFSWGNRSTIVRKSQELMELMDRAPHQFILQHTEKDLRKLMAFRHRTFNATDLLYFIEFFRLHYTRFDSLEDAFLLPWRGMPGAGLSSYDAAAALSAFHHYFLSPCSLRQQGPAGMAATGATAVGAAPPRTRKHIATPEKNSSCKRLNMFLRWMVRKDKNGVDFGCWNRIPMNSLICPLDLHVARVAKRFGLLTRKPTDWRAALELTGRLSGLDPEDPVKYDFALFALGAIEKF